MARLKVDNVRKELERVADVLEVKATQLQAEATRLRALAVDIYVYGGVYINPKDYPPDHPAPGDLGSVPL
jgi:hypothetical protein